MPIYEYECEKCGAGFERMEAISAKPVTTCINTKCGGKAHRQVSASGFILKGSGWYTSDYPSEARKQGWKQESSQANGVKPEAPCAAAPASAQPAAVPAASETKSAGKGRPVPTKNRSAAKKKTKARA